MLGSNIRVEPYDPGAGVQDVVQDVLRKQIRIYTPKGDVRELAEGATALDFAYAIHTGLGDQCSSASINGRRIPLNQPLKEGDQVHINKRDTARPMRAWLDEDLGYLVTNNARSHVRRWFRRLPLAHALLDGERILRTELAMLGKSNYAHDDVAKQLGLSDTEELYRQLGRAELLPTTLSTRLLENDWDETPARALDTVVYAPNGEKYVITNANGRQLSLCGACKPVPEDKIVGYVRQNSQVTVHQEECHLLLRHQDNGKWMKLAWGTATQRLARVTRIQIDVHDRHGLLYEISHLMHREQINIPDIHTPEAERQGEVRMVLDLEVTNPRQLVRILHQVRALVNVYRVRCLPDTTYDGNDLLRPSLYRPE
jgi:GTP pyrophosphokinase